MIILKILSKVWFQNQRAKMKKIEKKGKQKSDTGDSNAASDANVGKVKDENDKPLNYIKDEIQSEWCGLWVG